MAADRVEQILQLGLHLGGVGLADVCAQAGAGTGLAGATPMQELQQEGLVGEVPDRPLEAVLRADGINEAVGDRPTALERLRVLDQPLAQLPAESGAEAHGLGSVG